MDNNINDLFNILNNNMFLLEGNTDSIWDSMGSFFTDTFKDVTSRIDSISGTLSSLVSPIILIIAIIILLILIMPIMLIPTIKYIIYKIFKKIISSFFKNKKKNAGRKPNRNNISNNSRIMNGGNN